MLRSECEISPQCPPFSLSSSSSSSCFSYPTVTVLQYCILAVGSFTSHSSHLTLPRPLLNRHLLLLLLNPINSPFSQLTLLRHRRRLLQPPLLPPLLPPSQLTSPPLYFHTLPPLNHLRSSLVLLLRFRFLLFSLRRLLSFSIFVVGVAAVGSVVMMLIRRLLDRRLRTVRCKEGVRLTVMLLFLLVRRS